MGIYSTNRMSSYSYPDFEVATNENYDCTTGVAMALIDIQQNDLALFEAAICSDMNEIGAMNEGYEVINEAASDIFKKIKELFLKLIEKIKGIFKAFMAKFNGIFMDCKQLYNKYNKTIAKNTNWKNFKVKDFRDKKGSWSNIVDRINELGEYKYSNGSDNLYEFAALHKDTDVLGNIKVSQITDKDNHIDADDITDTLINIRFNNDLKGEVSDSGDLNDINKGFLDCLFEDAESKDGDDDWSTSDILHGVIGDILQEGDKSVHKIEQANNKLEGTLKSLVNKVDKEAQKVIKATSNARLGKDFEYTQTSVKLADGGQRGQKKSSAAASNRIEPDDEKLAGYGAHPSSGQINSTRTYSKNKATDKFGKGVPDVETDIGENDKTHLEIIERLAGFYQRCATTEQTLVTKLTGARLNAIKFAVGQARKIWSSAAAYASVDHKNESYEYYTAVGEAVLYDYETDIQAPVY